MYFTLITIKLLYYVRLSFFFPPVTFSRSLKLLYLCAPTDIFRSLWTPSKEKNWLQVFSWLSNEFIYHIWSDWVGLSLKLIILRCRIDQMQEIHIWSFSSFSHNCHLISKISINILFSSYILVIGLRSKFLSYLRLLHLATKLLLKGIRKGYLFCDERVRGWTSERTEICWVQALPPT